jgi:hypothetical protein
MASWGAVFRFYQTRMYLYTSLDSIVGQFFVLHYGILNSSWKQYVLPLLHQQLESRYEYPEEKDWKQIDTEKIGI